MSFSKPILQVGSNLFELIEFTVSSTPFRPGDEMAPDQCAAGEELRHSKNSDMRKNPMEAADWPLGASQKKAQKENFIDRNPSVFGVNVAKVREVIRLPRIVPCLSSSPEVLGVFNLRGHPIPAIHLALALGYSNEPVGPTSQVIVTEFSQRLAGFIVSSARRIRRVNWDRVLPPSSDAFNSITGMMLVENSDFIFILDFERILLDIEAKSGGFGQASFGGTQVSAPPSSEVNGADCKRRAFASQNSALSASVNSSGSGSVSNSLGRSQNSDAPQRPTVVVVDDSPTARRAVCDILRGLEVDLIEFHNGEQCWNALHDGTLATALQGRCIIISDVEMPRLDGYSLCMRVRKEPKFKNLPVVLHSSLSGEVNRERATKAGAAAYVSKFNKRAIIDSLDLFLHAGWNGKRTG